jgi:signal transduction histidine kinase
MLLTLFSRDAQLVALCRDILRTLPGNAWQLRLEDFSLTTEPSDLYIWDYEADLRAPAGAGFASAARHVMLVHPKHLDLVRERVPDYPAQVLLKPVTRAMLWAFLAPILGPAATPRAARPQAAAVSVEKDRDDLLQCLMQMNLRLQEYDQERTNFLARAVHDFRAPLTSLCGYCDLLLDSELGALSSGQRVVLERMQHSAKRLSRMAWAMFELSVGPQGDRSPRLRRGDLGTCLDQALHELMPTTREKGIDISIHLLPSLEPLYFESDQIEQVFINILDNGCKFTPKGGSIRIAGYPFFWERRLPRPLLAPAALERRSRDVRVPNAYRVDIRDSGPGIPPEHLSRIFEEYTRYHGATDRSGGGLGLAICRIILSRHHGTIWADNAGAGAIFSFVLPYRPAGATEDLCADNMALAGAAC